MHPPTLKPTLVSHTAPFGVCPLRGGDSRSRFFAEGAAAGLMALQLTGRIALSKLQTACYNIWALTYAPT